MMKKMNFINGTFLMLSLIVMFSSCSSDNSFATDDNVVVDDEQDFGDLIPIEGELTGTLGPNESYIVIGDIFVPENESLTLLEGTTLIMNGDGRPGNSPEINVNGSLYSYGTEEAPIYIGVDEDQRTEQNIFRGLWGGIIGTDKAENLVLEYTTIEFAGAPAEPGSSIVAEGELDEGEPRYAVYWVKPEGHFIMLNSRIAYTKDDAIRLNGGKTLIAHSEFAFNGETGGESVNTKSGVVGDFCYNVFYSVATNGLKAANSKGRQPQCNNNYYNNTMVGCGWRRSQSGRGGSLNFENGARGKSFNNLVADSRYGLRLFPPDDEPDMANMRWGNHMYYGNHEEVVEGFHPSNGIIGQNLPGYEDIVIPESDIFGDIGENDPQFVGYEVGTFEPNDFRNLNDVRFIEDMFETFKLQSTSPALNAGTTDFEPIFSEYVVNGRTYQTPLPSTFIGALGAE